MYFKLYMDKEYTHVCLCTCYDILPINLIVTLLNDTIKTLNLLGDCCIWYYFGFSLSPIFFNDECVHLFYLRIEYRHSWYVCIGFTSISLMSNSFNKHSSSFDRILRHVWFIFIGSIYHNYVTCIKLQ